MKKILMAVIVLLIISGIMEFYAHSVVKIKKDVKEKEILKLLTEKGQKEEKFELSKAKLKRLEEENKDLKVLKEGKK